MIDNATEDAAFLRCGEDVLLATQGDRLAFGRLVLNCERTLYRVSRTVLDSDDGCADAVQEALIKAWRNIHTLREPRHFQTWMIRILLNECYRQSRRTPRFLPLPDTEQAVNASPSVEAMDLKLALAALPVKLRTAVVLYHVEGLSVVETAQALGVPQGTVKSRLSRARENLARHIEL
jgi:RNA polymerase sigma-70 factor, ECF subfamily